MDETVETTAVFVPDEEFGVAHQLGKTLFSGAVAFGASKLADKLYDGAIRAYRARKSS